MGTTGQVDKGLPLYPDHNHFFEQAKKNPSGLGWGFGVQEKT